MIPRKRGRSAAHPRNNLEFEGNSEGFTKAVLLAIILLSVLTGVCYAHVTDDHIQSTASEPWTRDLSIFTADGKRMIGHSHYTMSIVGENEILRGESAYFDGEQDIEVELLRSLGQIPMLVTYKHSFFNSDHILERAVSLDARSGAASCKTYQHGKVDKEYQSTLSVPTDTYAGAAQLVFIRAQLRQGEHDIRFHSFNCTAEPKIMAARAMVETNRVTWSMSPGDLAKVDVQGDFGWFHFLVSPFTPKMYAWFDSSENWKFVGAVFDRYYRGPRILVVRRP